jgi:hypothetical protein
MYGGEGERERLRALVEGSDSTTAEVPELGPTQRQQLALDGF